MGWPYFTEELWLGSPDNGLVAAMYAPSQVRATAGASRTPVTLTMATDYPFDETVTITVATPTPVAFPLRLRVPGWCRGPRLTVNGQQFTAPDGPAFARVDRTWRDGDTVTLRLPQRTTLRSWPGNHGAVSVDHGPLTYSLRIGERYVRYAGTEAFPEYEVHATTPWNYGLASDIRAVVTRTGGPVPDNPFTHETVPVRITADARRIPEWIADSENVVAPLQDGPARSTAAVERVTLIPMGAARLRVTALRSLCIPLSMSWSKPSIRPSLYSPTTLPSSSSTSTDSYEPRPTPMGAPGGTAAKPTDPSGEMSAGGGWPALDMTQRRDVASYTA